MVQGAENLRGFFDSFFRLPQEMWTVSTHWFREGVVVFFLTFLTHPPTHEFTMQGFLAGWPGLPNNESHETWDRRLLFGIRFWLLSPPSLKFALVKAGVFNGGYPFIRSVTPLAELPESMGEDSPEPPCPVEFVGR